MEIIWSPEANEDFFIILNRVENLFGQSVAANVSSKIKSHVGLLTSFPRMGVRDVALSTNEIDIRYLVSTPNYIYYAIEEGTIYIISIFDSRQSPDTINRVMTENLKRYI